MVRNAEGPHRLTNRSTVFSTNPVLYFYRLVVLGKLKASRQLQSVLEKEQYFFLFKLSRYLAFLQALKHENDIIQFVEQEHTYDSVYLRITQFHIYQKMKVNLNLT